MSTSNRPINDKFLIEQVEAAYKYLYEYCPEEYKKERDKKELDGSELLFPFPLDKDTIEVLGDLLPKKNNGRTKKSDSKSNGNDASTSADTENELEILYSKADDLNDLWIKLIKKSIQCLRFFDTRESFQQDEECNFEKKKKHIENRIEAYGIDSLEDYQKRYIEFESMLYGQSEYYRDHVFHSFRVWLLGVYVLMREPDLGKERLIDELELDGDAKYNKEKIKINHFEWLSMWTIAALCHDLGYPLELVGSILNKTNTMMSDFFLRPNVSDNFTFTTTQGNFNDHILGLMSTKLYKSDDLSTYSGRIQQKYYFKYTRSLENNDHGIISAAIVFRKLFFFLESDFHLNDNSCRYEEEDARQFYIRREILRTMSSHTCDGIFHIKIQTLPALLFICDELQEWGRKSWGDLYKGTRPSQIELFIDSFNTKRVEITETIEMKSASELEAIFEEIARKFFKGEYSKYKKTFRDGPGTTNNPNAGKRKFDFKKEITIEFPSRDAPLKKLVVKYAIPQNKKRNKEFRVRIDSKLKRSELERRFKKKIKGLPYSDQLRVLP